MGEPEILTYGDVPADALRRVSEVVAGMGNLRSILAWGAAATPPRKPELLVAQDEYTHDVVMRFEDGVYIAFDVT